VATLTLSLGDHKLDVFTLQTGDCVIGRAPTCTLVIDSPDAQAEHACVRAEGDHFVVTTVNADCRLSLNQRPLEGTRTLYTGDTLQIGEYRLDFSGNDDNQRRFSRIPFDVNATLENEQRRWETSLLDISLHGALVKVPASFDSPPAQSYRLTVHLEGGPDVCMDVEVAHQEDERVGLNCKDIDVDSISHLRRLVELNLGDPQLLERELSALG